MSIYEPTDRSRIKRRPERGHYDREVVHRIIDEALIAHIGFVVEGMPCVIPTAIVRLGEDLYVHGSPNNHLLTSLQDGAQACITITLIDSIVAGRSAFGCSMDYRSVVVFSNAEGITDPVEKERIADAFVESIIPGHKVRRPKPKELGATLFLRFPINEASAKIRDVGVLDVDGDYELDLWAGRIPLRLTAGEAQSCARLKEGIEMPDYAKGYQRG